MTIAKLLRNFLPAGALLLVGCGGGSGGSSSLKGNAAFRAAALSSYQSLGSGVGFPYAALKAASPEGSGPLGGSSSPLGTGSSPLLGNGSLFPADAPGGLMLVPGLGLYAAAASFSGDVVTLGFFADSAGTESAGAVTITLPPSASASSGLVDYTSYPDVVKIAINITAGALPSSGNLSINFTGSSGANTLTGTITTRGAIKLDLDLTLSEALDVGGTLTVTQNGEVMKCKNVTGVVTGDLHCDLTVAPFGWTGSGMFNLLTGQLLMNVTTGDGAASAGSDGTGGLNLGYPDGTSESVADANSAALTGGVIGSDGGMPSDLGTQVSASFGTTGQAFASILQLNNMGQILGTISGTAGGPAQSVFAPSLAALAVSLGTGTAYGMNNLGQVVGASTDGHALYWAQPNATPTTLDSTGYTNLSASAITDAGEIVGRGMQGNTYNDLYWATATAVPVALSVSTDYGVTSTAPVAGVSSDGQIAGQYYSISGNDYHLLYWANATGMPTVLPAVGATTGYLINTQAQIIGLNYAITNCIGPNYLAGLTAQPITLPSALGDTGCGDYLTYAINNKGLIVGTEAFGDLNHQHAVYWKNGQLADLNDLLPSTMGIFLVSAVAVNDSGQIACSTAPLMGMPPAGDAPFMIVTLK